MTKECPPISDKTISLLPQVPQDAATKLKIALAAIPTKDERPDGELTIPEFMDRHSCLPDDAAKLRAAYLTIAPRCTHPLAICSSIVTSDKSGQETLSTLMERLKRISEEKQPLKPI